MKLIAFLALLVPAILCAQSSHLSQYLQESFDGPALPVGWTVSQITGPLATWSIVGTGTNPPIAPFLAPGQAQFNSYDAGPGEQARLISPAVNLSAALDPFLELHIYHDDEFPSSMDSVYVEISTGDSIVGPWTIIQGIRRPSGATGWATIAISLLDYAANNRVFASFRGVSKYGNNMYLDEVRIADSSFHDIGTVAFEDTPTQDSAIHDEQRSRTRNADAAVRSIVNISVSGLTVLSVVVSNNGTFDEPTYQVAWELDTEGQAPVSNPTPIVRNSVDTLSLPVPQLAAGAHTITAWTELSGDLNHANDTIRTIIFIPDSSILFFEGFNGSSFPPTGWSVVNGDGSLLEPWFRGSASSVFVPFEGQGFAANNFQRANGTYIDDYLITPQIAGAVQASTEDSLIFWTRSAFSPPPFPNYPDSLMILISVTGNDTASFTTILDYFDVPKTGWNRKAFRLTGSVAQNADIYIAFRYLHYNGGQTGSSSDFIGVDAVQIKQQPPLAVSDRKDSASEFRLEQNYPNPFNPTTEIRFRLPADLAGIVDFGMVTLKVFDVLGREVATLANEMLHPGNYQRTLTGIGLSSGIYYYVLKAGRHQATKKMILIR